MDAEQIVVTPTPEALLDGVEPAGWMYEHSAPGAWPQIAVKRLRDSFGSNWTETPLYTRAQVLAAVEAHRAGRWLPIESAPVDEQILASIKVRNKDGRTWWEHHIIVIDSDTGTISDMDFHHGWEADDYSHWQPLPTPPSQDTQP